MGSPPATNDDTKPPRASNIQTALALTVEAEAIATLLAAAIAGLEQPTATLHAAAAGASRLLTMAVGELTAALDRVT